MRIRIADTEDARRAVIRVAHAANGVRSPLATYTALRLKSPLRRRARWWLLEVGEVPVASLLAYPLVFGLGEARLRGFGLGSVATHPDHRGQGHATALCEAVAEAYGEDDRGLLFSAIDPGFYARLGYAPVEACQWRIADPSAVEGPRAALVPIDPLAELERLSMAWTAGHPGLFLPREAEDWRHSLIVGPADVFFAVDGGYVRLVDESGELEILELFADDVASVVRAVCDLAAALGRTVVTWHPLPTDGGLPLRAESRSKTLPMVRKLPADGAAFWGSDYF